MEEKDFAAALHQSGYDFGKLTGTYGHYEDFKLQKPEVYRNTDMFKNQPEEEFNKWYKGIQEAYNEYENGRVANPTSISAGYALDDPISRTIGLATAPNMSVSFTPNKREYTKDFAGVEKAKYSMHEVAQKNTRYRDSRTGKMIENGDGIGGMLDFFSIGAKKGGLWLAHDENKNPVTDLYGNYYYETIEGKDTSGKEHLMLTFDNAITDEDSALNSLDFMDSDQIEQNVGRSLIKEGLKVASNFNPITRAMLAAGWVATTGMSLFGEAYKSISALGNAFSDGSFDPNKYKPSKEAEDIGNRVSNWGKMLTISSQTEEAQRDPFSMEGILNMIGSGATQIAGQRMLMEAPLFIKSVADPKFQKALQAGDKSAQRFLNVTKNAATAYMTAQSAQEVGEQFEAAGFDKGTKDIFMGIAAITLGAFYKASPFETWMLDKFDDKIAKSQVNKVLKETMDDFKKIYSPQTINAMSEPEKAAVAASFMTGVKKKLQGIGDFLGKGYGGNEIIKGTIGEGLEEPTEVIFGEVFKTAAQVMNKFNLLDEKDAKKYEALNPFGDDFFHEMAVSAVGGALAGGMTGIIDRVQNGKKNDRLETLSDIVQSGYTDTALQQIENLRKANIASGNLSAVYYDVSDGKRVYKTYNPNDPTDVSQADYIANSMAADIRKLKTAYEGIGATRDDLNKISQQFNRIAGDANLFQAASISSIVEDARAISRELVKVQLEKEKIAPLIPGKDNPGEDDKNKKLLAELTAKETQLLEKFNYYKSIGQDANPIIEDYLEEALFNKNYVLQNGFKVKNKIDFITNEDGSEKKGVDLKKGLEQWEEYRTTQRPKDLRDAFLEAKTKISKNGGDSYFRALYNVGDQESELKSRVRFSSLDNRLYNLTKLFPKVDKAKQTEILNEIKNILATPDYTPDSRLLPELDPLSKLAEITKNESILPFNRLYKNKDVTLSDYIQTLGSNTDVFSEHPILAVTSFDEHGIFRFNGVSDNKGGGINVTENSDKTEQDALLDKIKNSFNEYASDPDVLNDLSDDEKEKLSALKKELDNVNNVQQLLDLIINTSDIKDHLNDAKSKLSLYNNTVPPLSSKDDTDFTERAITDNDTNNTIEKFQSQAEIMQSDFKGDDIENGLQELINKINQKRAILQIPGYIKPIINKLKSINAKYFAGKKTEDEVPALDMYETNAIDNMYRSQLKRATDLLELARTNGKVQTKSIEARYVYGALQVAKNIVSKAKITYDYDDELKRFLDVDEKTLAQEKDLGKLANFAYKELINLSNRLHKEYDNDNKELKKALVDAKKTLIDVTLDNKMDDFDALSNTMMISLMRGDVEAFFDNIHSIKEGSEKVPTFEQEMVLFQAFSAYQYHENKKINKVSYPEIETKGFDRGIFVNSNPGIGKSDILITYLARLINNVQGDLKISSPKSKVVSEILEKSFPNGDPLNAKLIKDPKDLGITGTISNGVATVLTNISDFTAKSGVVIPDFKLSRTNNDSPSEYIILDEATHLTESDIQALHTSGKFIFMFGDTNQLGATINLPSSTGILKTPTLSYLPGLEKAPRITMSFRNRTENYDSNSNTIAKLSNELHETAIDEVNNAFESKKKNNELLFVYDEKNTKGVSPYSESLENEIVEKALAEGSSIVIVDNSLSPNPSKVPIVTFNEVQGREFDYVIIRNMPDLSTNDGPFQKLQTINTLLSRYKKAMLVPKPATDASGKIENDLGLPVQFTKGPVVDQLVMTKEKADSMRVVSLAATSKNAKSQGGIAIGAPTPEVLGSTSPASGATSLPPGSYAGAYLPESTDVNDEEYDENISEFKKNNTFFYFGESGTPSVKEAINIFKQLLSGKTFSEIKINSDPLSDSLRLVKTIVSGKEAFKLVYLNDKGETVTLFRFPIISEIPHLSSDSKKDMSKILNGMVSLNPFNSNQLQELEKLFNNTSDDSPIVMPFRRIPASLTQDNFLEHHSTQGIHVSPALVITVNPIKTVLELGSPYIPPKTIEDLLLDQLKKHFPTINTLNDLSSDIKSIIDKELSKYELLLGRAISFISTDENLVNVDGRDAIKVNTLLKQYMLSNILSRIPQFAKEYADKRVTITFRKEASTSLVDYINQVKAKVELIENLNKSGKLASSSTTFEKVMDVSDLRRIGESLYNYISEKLKVSDLKDPLIAKLLSNDESLTISLAEDILKDDGTIMHKAGELIPITQALFGFRINYDKSTNSYNIIEYFAKPNTKSIADEKLMMGTNTIPLGQMPIILKKSKLRTQLSRKTYSKVARSLDYTSEATILKTFGLMKFTSSIGKVNSSLLLYQLLKPVIDDNKGDVNAALSTLSVPINNIRYRTGIIWNKADNKNKAAFSPAANPDNELEFEANKEFFPTIAIPNERIDKFLGISMTSTSSSTSTGGGTGSLSSSSTTTSSSASSTTASALTSTSTSGSVSASTPPAVVDTITLTDGSILKGTLFKGLDAETNVTFDNNGIADFGNVKFSKLDNSYIITELNDDGEISINQVDSDFVKAFVNSLSTPVNIPSEVTALVPTPSTPYIKNKLIWEDSSNDRPTTYVFTSSISPNEALEDNLGLWINSFGDPNDPSSPKIPTSDIRKRIFGNNTDLEVLVYDEMLNGMFGDIFLYNPRTGEMGLTHDKVKELNEKINANRLDINNKTRDVFSSMGFVSSGDLDVDVLLMLKMLKQIDPNKISNDVKKTIAVFLAYNVGHHLLKGNVFSDINKVVNVTTDGNRKIYYSMTNVVKEHSYLQESGNVDGLDGGSQFISAFLNRYEKVTPTIDPATGTIDFDNLTAPDKVFANKADLLYGFDELLELLNYLNVEYNADDINDILIKGLEAAKNNYEIFGANRKVLSTLATLKTVLGIDGKLDPVKVEGEERYSINNMLADNISPNQKKALYQLRSAFVNTFKLKQVKPDMVINGKVTKESNRVRESLVAKYKNALSKLDINTQDAVNTISELNTYFNIITEEDDPSIDRVVFELRQNLSQEDVVKNAPLTLVNVILKLIGASPVNAISVDNNSIIKSFEALLNGELADNSVLTSILAEKLADLKMDTESALKRKTTYPTVDGATSGIFSNINLILSNLYNKFADRWNKLNNC